MIESGLKRLNEADLHDGEELKRDNDTIEEEEVDLRQQEEDTADVEKNTEISDQTVQVLVICLISFTTMLTSTFILIVAMVLMILLILREVRRRNTPLEWLGASWPLRMRFLGR